ncbi:hypothetical protein BAUCODRAFT_118214 [Baudoinia panamericana UAMH 10762]|uniref:ferric-chelate reductase (NADPH) n=1 Tax=Baudoinia panamericana (strain UAMH 10762) TaxID=717646 RepID=M2M0C4_BAUPA|nr:uncharacterized protein BAUCODRAFT_118214 [Baudoinia panamericana UAMH 10762]EMD00448.1 hypothetical protein BAUCODRAFT_118214 [Baudoinia panamericana UAMH 10762]
MIKLALLAVILPLVFAQNSTTISHASSSTTSGHAAAVAQPTAADIENIRLARVLGCIWLAIVAVLFVNRWTNTLLKHLRRLANLNHSISSEGRQSYFSIPNERLAKLKRHLFRLSAATNIGTLPTRLQTIVVVGYLALNFILCAVTINWHDKHAFYVEGRNRTGVLAVLNMIPLILLAGRNNPLLWLLDITFDTYNLLHRWIGRIVVLEAVTHASFWMAGMIATSGSHKGWAMIKAAMASSQLIMTGTIGACTLATILLLTPSIVRHAFYETFLHIHILLGIVAIAATWVHTKHLTTLHVFVQVAITCWVIERVLRVYSLVRNNTGRGVTKAEVEALPGDAVRITLRMARPWKFRPGQHIFLYMPTVGLWTSHPFSLAWSNEDEFHTEKGLPMNRFDIYTAGKPTSMSLIVRRRTGFTDAMYRKAEKSPQGRFNTTAFVEGPYGDQSFQSYGTVMLFAAGVGITHQVPHVRDLVGAYANGTCATRRVILVWIIQSPEHLEWIRPWMTQILGMSKRRDILKILLFVTRPRSTREIHSPSASVQMFPGKPDVGALIDKEQAQQVGAMAISVCGTGSLSDDVRKAMRDRCEMTEMDFFEEAFSW